MLHFNPGPGLSVRTSLGNTSNVHSRTESVHRHPFSIPHSAISECLYASVVSEINVTGSPFSIFAPCSSLPSKRHSPTHPLQYPNILQGHSKPPPNTTGNAFDGTSNQGFARSGPFSSACQLPPGGHHDIGILLPGRDSLCCFTCHLAFLSMLSAAQLQT